LKCNYHSEVLNWLLKLKPARKKSKTDLATAQLEISTFQENNQLLEIAPKGKEGKEALDAIRADIEGINTSVSDVPVLLKAVIF
jgi:hypothetical protein